MEKMQTNRTYKSRIFEMIFSDPKELLGLYNAVNGTKYEDPGMLRVNTLDSLYDFLSERNCKESAVLL